MDFLALLILLPLFAFVFVFFAVMMHIGLLRQHSSRLDSQSKEVEKLKALLSRIDSRLQRLEHSSPKEDGSENSGAEADSVDPSAWAGSEMCDDTSESISDPIHSLDELPAAKAPPPPPVVTQVQPVGDVTGQEPPEAVVSSDGPPFQAPLKEDQTLVAENQNDLTYLQAAEEVQPSEPETQSARSDAEGYPIEPAASWSAVEAKRKSPAGSEMLGHGSVGTVEETFGSRILVWIGGVALVLAGAFMVRYSIENQLLSLQTRHWLAGMMGLGLVAAGSWMRTRASGAATALVGAGVVVLYLVLFSATGYFGLITPGVGFTLLILLTAGAVGLSVWHGQFAAVLGCLGGFASPLLVGGNLESPLLLASPSVFFGYLLLLQAGLIGTAAIRDFDWVARLTLVGTLLWCVVYWELDPVEHASAWTLGYFLVATAMFQVYDWLISRDLTFAPEIQDRPGLVSLYASAALVSVAVATSGYAFAELMLLYALASGSLVLGLLRPSLRGHGVLIGGLVTMMVAGGAGYYSAEAFRIVVVIFGAMYVLVALAVSFTRPGGSMVYPLIVCVGVPVYYLIGMDFALTTKPWGGVQFGPNGWWTAAIAALLPTVLVIRFFRCRPKAAGPAALSAAGMVTWAVSLALVDQRAWLLVGLCLLATAVGGITVLTGLLAWLRWAWCWLAVGVMWILIEARLSITWPEIWVTAAVSLAAIIAFAILANLAKRQKRTALAVGMVGTAVFAPLLGLSILVVQWFKDGPPSNIPERLGETGTQILLLLSGAVLVAELARRIVFPGLLKLSQVVGLITVTLGLVFLAIVVNPLLTKEVIGGPVVFNPILIYYGSAAALLWAMVWQWAGSRLMILRLSRASALLFTAVLGILLVRHGFVGELLSGGQAVVPPEWTAYGVVVMVMALALLEHRRRQSSDESPVDVFIFVSLALAAWVGGALLLANPLWTDYAIAGPKVFNMLWWIYGTPALLFWVMVWQSSGNRSPILFLSRASALLFTAVLGILLVRHGFVGELLSGGQAVVPSEWTAYGVVVMVMAVALLEYRRRRSCQEPPVDVVIFLSAALAAWIGGASLLANPLWTDHPIGGAAIFNILWWIYGVPALALAWASVRYSRTMSPDWSPHALAGVSILLGFGLVTIQVRHYFSGPELSLIGASLTDREWYGYSAAWLVYGVLLFGGGLFFRTAALRYGSLVVMLVAVGKAFLVDASQLDGLLRVGSFLGLGVILVLMGYVYQRFVFQKG